MTALTGRGAAAAVALATVLVLVAGCGSAGPRRPGDAEGAHGAGAASDAVLADLLADDAPGCSAAVGRRGEVVWAGARGLADVAASAPLSTATTFDLASVSKQFTAVAVVRLAHAGELALTDALSTHVPALPAWAAAVTVDDLLHHTSGIPDYTGLLLEAGTGLQDPADQADALAAVRSVAERGEDGVFSYSNSNYVLLAEVVRAAAGQDLGQVLESQVFGDHDLRLEPAPQGSGVAVPHMRAGTGWRASPSAWTQVGDGSVVTTPSALVAWADLYRTDDAVRAAITDGAVETGAPDRSRYGRGLVVGPDGALSHSGGWSGYTSVFGVSGDGATVIGVACNGEGAPVAQVAERLRGIWV